jgi:hypothetical protein
MMRLGAWLLRHLPEGLLVVLCALAFVPGVQATGDLNWPGDQDLLRDIAQSQTFVDGDWLADPQYLGETIWYNPLTPSIVATVARVTNQPVPVLYTRLGAYLNFLAPIGLYLLVALLLDRWAAVGAVFAFLFMAPPTNEPSWAVGTYSPWLFTANFAQGWMYLTLAAYVIALRRATTRWWALVGGLLGITFLAHTAPAVIVGGIIALHTSVRAIQSRSLRRPLIALGAIIIAALIVSAPLTLSIVGRYQLHVLNPAPTNWAYEPLTLRNFEAFIQGNFIDRGWTMLLVGLGLIAVWRNRRAATPLITFWLIIALAFLIYHYVRQLARRDGVILPTIVPGFHFLLYFRVAQSMLLGGGVMALGALAANFAAKVVPCVRGKQSGLARGLSLAILAGMLITAYPAYLNSDDLVGQRIDAEQVGQNTDRITAYQWVRANTQRHDVFLAGDSVGTFVISPAGRKLIAGDSVFVSPYVDWAAHNADREALWAALEAQDEVAFRLLMAKYQSVYVAVSGDRLRRLAADMPPFVERVFASETVQMYRLRQGGDAGKPIVISKPDSIAAQALNQIAQKVAAGISVLNLAE